MKKLISYLINFYEQWNWLLMIVFLILSIIDFRFGIGAILCILPAFGMALASGRKKFCASACPRGNFLNRVLKNIHTNVKTPALFRSKVFKNLFFIVMFGLFIKALSATGGDAGKIGFVFFRFILASTVIGLILGAIYKPRTWCQICPLGQGSQIVGNISLKIKDVYQ